MGILSKVVKSATKAAVAKRAAAKAKKKAAEVAARAKAAKARVADKPKPKAKPSVRLRDKTDDAARAKADKAAEGLKGSGETLSTKLRKEAKANAVKDGPKKTGATPGKKKDTPEAAEADRKKIVTDKKARTAKSNQATTQRKGSIAKKATVSKTDINQAKDKLALDAYENKVNDMPAGDIKTELKRIIKLKRDAFEKMQAREKDMVVVKSTVAARAKKMKDKVSLSRFDSKKEDKDLNRGGLAKKKKGSMYNKGGMPMVMKDGKKVPEFAADGVGKMNKGGMAMKKPAKKMMAGGMAKKKPAAKKMMAGGMAKKKMMGGGMAKSTGYMYGGMAKKKAKK